MAKQRQELINTREDNSDDGILAEARERATYGAQYWDEQWRVWEQDLNFIDGQQWDPSDILSRQDAKRPVLTVNTLQAFIDQVLNDGLMNRPAIHVSPADSTGDSIKAPDAKASPEAGKIKSIDGKSSYTLAEIYEGLIRQGEAACGATDHYDTALQHGIETGMGWLVVGTRYCAGITMDQEWYVKAVRNRWAVIMDPDATEPDMSDANWGLIIEEMDGREFRKRYPGANSAPISDHLGDGFAWWTDGQKVRVAQYWRREPVTRELIQLSSGEVCWADDLKVKKPKGSYAENGEPGVDEIAGDVREDSKGRGTVLDELQAAGITIVRSRKVMTHKVVSRLVTGFTTLEPDKEWPGTTIPIVPVAGKRLDFPDKRIYRGLIHNTKDAKRAENYFLTAAVERIGMAPKAPWVGEVEMFEGHERYWRTSNTENHAYLPYNRTASGNKPERAAPAPMPAAELQMSNVFTDKVKATVGMYDASLGQRSNETSGKAIIARQRESDTGSFVFMDNLNKAIRRIGLILVEIIPRIMDGERVIRILNKDQTEDWVEINKTIIDEQTGERVIINDIQAGKMDVRVKAGPSYNTQRQEAVEALLEFVRVVPAAGAVILDKIAANMDWPGADEIARRLRKIIPKQVLTAKEQEEVTDPNAPPPEPTIPEQIQMLEAQGVLKTAEATISTAKANEAMAQAKTAEAQARMLELQSATAGGSELEERIRDIVAETMAQLMATANQNTVAAPAETATPAGA